MQTRWLIRIYLAVLRLFPTSFREEYGEELAYAIRMAAADAGARGQRALARLAWRELRDLPPALLAAHLVALEGHAMKLQAGSYLSSEPIRGAWLALLFVPFLLPLVFTVIAATGAARFVSLWTGLFLMFGLGVLATAAAGLVRGPLWALPALGMLLGFVWVPFKWAAQMIILLVLHPFGNYWPRAIPAKLAQMAALDVAFFGIAAAMLALLVRLSPPLQQRTRGDWSWLSFVVYGMSIGYVRLNDDYVGLAPYQVASALLLAAGAALFLLAPERWQRLLALVAALLLAQPVVSLGVYLVFPAQVFATPDPSFRLWETLGPVLELPVLVALVCLPALLPRFPLLGPEPGNGITGVANPQGQG